MFSKKKLKTEHGSRRRQWGTETRMDPLTITHEHPTVFKIALGRIAIVLTILFWAVYINSTIMRQFIEGPASYHFTMEAYSYALVVTVLTFSALMYLTARQGAYQRFMKHVRVPRSVLEKFFATHRPAITVLVPSYDEEPDVIRKTLFSAALQEYPDKRIVLLLDDNPFPTDPVKIERLKKTRAIGASLQKLLRTPRSRASRAYAAFQKLHAHTKTVTPRTVAVLAGQYRWAADWLTAQADKESVEDHVDIFFTTQVLRKLASDLTLVASALESAIEEQARLSTDRVRELYQRLTWIFTCSFTVFERKRYATLSQESNKAMNLNSYIGLMGGKYRTESSPDGLVLVPVTKAKDADLVVPDSPFLLTLDADSILLREYCLRLVYFLEQSDNARVAVTQTPYSSFRGAFSRIERISGATTDIQHILHQGLSNYGATFWVGANAVIRKRALEDIVQKEWVGGVEIKRYIQDRTVIEDTESSIDLAVHGWQLVNYPERLSYSATPPDFGSLVIQRRRWANGGLLIFPKLLAQIRERSRNNEIVSKKEIMLRLNYMVSIAWATFGLIFLLAYPYDGRLLSPLVLLAALPYFLAMASDLRYCGYRYSDIFRIYGFNLILLPVNLAGVLKSLEQAITGKKIAFARTPKVKDRTSVPLLYLIVPILIVAFSVFTVWRNVVGHNWGNAIFAGFNAVTATWAILAYIGLGNLVVDLWLGLTNLLYVEPRPARKRLIASDTKPLDWKVVLYHGEDKGSVPHAALGELVLDAVSNKGSGRV